MHGATADALAAVVSAEGERMVTTCEANVVPIEVVGAFFVAHPVALRIPKGAGIETDDAKACASETLQEDATARTEAHDEVVDFFALGKAMHGRFDPLHGTEHVRLAIRRLELAEEGRFQCVPPCPGDPCCSSSPATGSKTPETEAGGAVQS